MEYTERRIVNIEHGSLMRKARVALTDKWGIAVPTFLIAMVISGVAGVIPLASLLVGGPLGLGLALFSLKIARDEHVEISNLFDGFQNFGNAIATYLLMMMLVILGIVFFIIPGIVIGLGLSLSLYVLAEEPEIGPVNALKKSWAMMDGYKMDLLILSIRFIPWVLLCLLTLGIGFFWLAPYYNVTIANFYRAIKFDQDEDDNELEDDITKHMVDDLDM